MGPLGLPDRVSGFVLGLQELKSSVMFACPRPAAEAGVVPGGRVWWGGSLPGTMGAVRAGTAVSGTPFAPWSVAWEFVLCVRLLGPSSQRCLRTWVYKKKKGCVLNAVLAEDKYVSGWLIR